MKIYPHWGSHLPVLIKVIQATKGPVLELGMGIYSTPILHWLCDEGKRELVSYDQVGAYMKWFKHFENDYHKISLVNDWDDVKIERHWDVALVDHNDDRRRIELERLANWAKYIVVHDTDPETDYYYKYSEVFPRFKYRHDYTNIKNNVGVVSNFVDLSNL